MSNNNRIIEDNILLKKTKQDKNGNDYLLLELEKGEVIFVFPSKVKKTQWENLQEQQKYEFTVQEGNNGSNILLDFFGEGEIFV